MLGDLQVDQIHAEQESDFSQTINKTLPIKDLPPTLTCLSIYGNQIYVGTNQFKTYIYEIRSYQAKQDGLSVELRSVIQSHCQIVNLIAVNYKWLIIVPFGEQKQQLIRIWQRKELQLFMCLKGHTKKINNLHIASVSYDGTAKIWLVDNDAQFNTLIADCDIRYPILAITEISEDVVAFGGDNCIVAVWNWRKNQIISRSFGHLGSVSTLFSSQNGLYSLGGDSKLKKWVFQQQSGLHLQRIFQHNLNHTQFMLDLGNSQYFLIDMRGKTALIQNQKLYLGYISVKYNQTIKDMLFCENSILLILKTSKKQEVCSFDLSEHILHMHNNPQKGNPFRLKIPQNKNANSIRLTISWCRLSSHDKQVINLQGLLQTGEHLTVISYPSNESSTLFMKILYRGLTEPGGSNNIEGEIIVNGKEIYYRIMAKITVFAKIDGVFHGRLNVYQTLKFAIRLKNWTLSERQQEKLCRRIIKLVKLQNIKNMKIKQNKSQNLLLFHGKLLQIALLLIQNPKILFLSSIEQNLSQRECFKILKMLSNLAKSQSIIIINNINPPPYLILKQLKNIYLIKGNQCIYSGIAQKILQDQSQEFYHKKDTVLQHFFQNYNHFWLNPSFHQRQNGRIIEKKNEQQISQTTQNKNKFDDLIMINKRQITITNQFWELFKYQTKVSWVKSNELSSKFIIAILIPFLIGVMFLGLGKNFSQLNSINNERILNLFHFIFVSQLSTLYCSYIYSQTKYNPISKSIEKQLKSSLYSSTSLTLSLIAFECVDKLLLGAISSFILLAAFDINFESTRVIVFISIITIINIFGAFLGIILSFSSKIFCTAFSAILIFVTFFNGILCNTANIPSYTRWMTYLSPLKHSFILALEDLLGSSSFAILRQQGIQSLYGFDEDYSLTLSISLSLFFMAPLYLAYLIHKLQRSA